MAENALDAGALEDPLGIRADARFVAGHSDHVSIDLVAIDAFSEQILQGGARKLPEWELGYHFADGSALTVAYLFVLDALNFCFWGDPKWRRPHNGQYLDGYWALAAALTQEARTNPGFFDAHALAILNREALERVLAGSPPIPLFKERTENLRELGRWIAKRFRGSFTAVLEAANFDAMALVSLLADALSSFRDEAVYKGRAVRFYKRAQILAADLYGAFGAKGYGKLSRVQSLTAFADYKVPQILRHYGILNYSERLSGLVDQQIELKAGSREEVEIRANMIWAVELIRARLESAGVSIPSYKIDWFLWSQSRTVENLKPHHRTRTIFY